MLEEKKNWECSRRPARRVAVWARGPVCVRLRGEKPVFPLPSRQVTEKGTNLRTRSLLGHANEHGQGWTLLQSCGCDDRDVADFLCLATRVYIHDGQRMSAEYTQSPGKAAATGSLAPQEIPLGRAQRSGCEIIRLAPREGVGSIARIASTRIARMNAPRMQPVRQAGHAVAGVEEPQEQIVVLGPGHVPIGVVLQDRFAKHPSGMNEWTLDEAFAMDVFRCEQAGEPAGVLSVPFPDSRARKQQRPAAHTCQSRIRFQRLRLLPQALRVHEIVSVHAGDHLSLARAKPAVERSNQAETRLRKHPGP